MTTPANPPDVANFITDAQLHMLDQMDRALRRISKLPWGQRWRAREIADKALGIGPYWDSWNDGWWMWFVRRWRYYKNFVKGENVDA